MFSGSKKPYSAISVYVERLTSPEYEEDDFSGIPDLIEVIRIQDTGPTEAARAVRKKLKYGSSHRQLRALTILDGLIQNAGGRFQRTFADEALLERLRTLPRDDLVDADVRQKCNKLFRQWAVAYKGTPGLTAIADLHRQLPTRAKPHASQSRVVRQNDAEAAAENPFGEDPPSPPPSQAPTLPESRKASTSRPGDGHASGSKPATSSSASSFFGHTHSHSRDKDKDKKKKTGSRAHPPFSLEREKGKILQAIASASMTSTNLVNALQLVNREQGRVSDDAEVVRRFETCKLLRRQILRYIQLVESDEWIGGLLTANDDLVRALMAYEIMDKSIEDDSDSEYEGLTAGGKQAAHGQGQQQEQQQPRRPSRMEDSMAAMSLGKEQAPAKPPRPSAPQVAPAAAKLQQSDSEEDDPFGDSNAV